RAAERRLIFYWRKVNGRLSKTLSLLIIIVAAFNKDCYLQNLFRAHRPLYPNKRPVRKLWEESYVEKSQPQ
ncbi:hypothetical protein LJC15_03310, partial [Desulfovibrio sp. OttesenSCG-928-G11]|nr:hypothetical protein [Desulfovibrio sp. OttesenSCG-928-G11]